MVNYGDNEDQVFEEKQQLINEAMDFAEWVWNHRLYWFYKFNCHYLKERQMEFIKELPEMVQIEHENKYGRTLKLKGL